VTGSVVSPAQIRQHAISLVHQGQTAAARAQIEELCQSSPQDAEAWYLLGALDEQMGNQQQAINSYRRTIQLAPGHADAHNNLGALLEAGGRLDDAAIHYGTAVANNASHVPALFNSGNVATRLGRWVDAVDWFQRVIAIKPDIAEAHYWLGFALKALGRHDDAATAIARAVTAKPGYTEALNTLGNLQQVRGQFSASMQSYEQALRTNPDFAEAWNNLGTAQLLCGQIEEARASYLKAMHAAPEWAGAHSNYLLSLNYSVAAPDTVYGAHREWAVRHGHEEESVVHLNSPEPDRRLRIGYVSPDFRDHSVAFFVASVLEAHDRNEFDVICFANVQQPDKTTSALKGLADEWHDISRLGDLDAADLIRWHKIDILVDLAGHTADNRLDLFARRPAPVQVTYLGYPNTTGVAHMDYRLTDDVSDPAGAFDAWYSEKLVRLPQSFLCYTPPAVSPPVGPVPVERNGFVTFGCFNNCAKFSPDVLKAWEDILVRIPDAHLILKGSAFCDESVRDRFRRHFDDRGIASDRIRLLPRSPSLAEHLNHYNALDIALDTYPYNGTTTTCEALWMGVPVVTWRGQAHASRVGLSILTTLGMPELAAANRDDYVERIVALARTPERLLLMRQSLRERVARSPICDKRRFVAGLETSYRRMWRAWCSDPAKTPAKAIPLA
jgi:predicted O-linked N-acetylglucosamine transferase (SPINDLY family)